MAISSPGIGSNLDVNSIVKQLMAAEAQPLSLLDRKEASYLSKLTAFGSLKGALTSFQTAASALNNPAKFQGMSALSGDTTIVKASASSTAAAGSYNVNVTQLAQAQALMSSGLASATATIGGGTSTTLTFSFGTISGGNFISNSSKLSTAVATNGIPANSISINGSTIATSSSTNSAKELATQINLLQATTGVSASAAATDTGEAAVGALGALGAFTTITPGAGSYSLSVGGVSILSSSTGATDAAALDAAITAKTAALNAAGITVSGQAAGTGASALRFTRADGSNIAVTETLAGGATGGFTTTVAGNTKTFTSSVTLTSPGAITIGGSNPSLAGLTAGILPNAYSGASFVQDSNQATGTVTIDSTNNTLQGIRDAINKANIGVTATIVSDGSSTPNRLVIASNKTGATSSMKIAVSGGGDSAISNLMAYDPAGTQKLTQTTVAQSAALTVNGVAVTNTTNSISEAIQGVSLTVSKVGSTTVSVSRDTTTVTSSVNAFVKAFNDINKTIKDLTAYNSTTKTGGPLVGDATARAIQNRIRQVIGTAIPELGSNSIKTLADIGITVNKDGVMAADSTKLQNAITNNPTEISALFSAMGKTTDSMVSFVSSTSATKPGKYDINITKLASQGKAVGTVGAGLTITSGVNDKLDMSVDGVNATVTLAAGTYTIDSLVSQVQSVINGASAYTAAGISVKVSANVSNVLTIESNRYGSASKVLVAGSGAASLMGAPESTSGEDVAGQIGGITATGSGQFLTGATGSINEGLKLQITGGALLGRGTVNVSHGYAYQLNSVVESYLTSSGIVTSRTDGINKSIKDIGRQRELINSRLVETEKRLRAQFTALDTAISGMTRTSTFLQQQLSNLPKIE